MTRRSIISPLIIVLLLCMLAAAQVSPVARTESSLAASRADSPGTESTNTQLKQRYPRYRVQKSDVLEVKFAYTPDFDQAVTVHPDGYITLNAIGDVQVENKTLPELTEAIRSAYRGVLHDPVITVSLKDFDKPFFIAAGQVGHPGKYELRSDTTLVEALALAGGLTEASKHSQVVLFRRVSNETVEARTFDVKRMLGSRNLQEDPHLSPGDMLFVPQNEISKVRHYLPTSSMGLYVTPNPF